MREINEIAKEEGWEIADVIDNGKTNPRLQIFGLTMTNQQATQFVINSAKRNSKFHQGVLKQLLHSRQVAPPAPTRKRK